MDVYAKAHIIFDRPKCCAIRVVCVMLCSMYGVAVVVNVFFLLTFQMTCDCCACMRCGSSAAHFNEALIFSSIHYSGIMSFNVHAVRLCWF